MCFNRNVNVNKDGKFLEVISLSCVTFRELSRKLSSISNVELWTSESTFKVLSNELLSIYEKNQKSQTEWSVGKKENINKMDE